MSEEEALPHKVIPETGAMDVDRTPDADVSSDEEDEYDYRGMSQLPGV